MHALNRRAPEPARGREDLRPCAPLPGVMGLVLDFGQAFSLAEVSEKLGISLREVQAHVDDGTLVAFPVGRGSVRRHLRVLDEDLEGFVRRRKGGVVGAAFVPPKAAPHRKPDPEPEDYAARREARLAARDLKKRR